jgi:hypothetical protein
MPSTDWFRPVAQFNGLLSQPVSMTVRLPWLYVIAALRERLLYIGETYDEGGLVVRLGRHFGPYNTSTFRKRCHKVAGVINPKGPFLVIAAKMPSGDDAPIDCTSKQIRLLCETYVHSRVATRFLASRPEWVVVSSSTVTKIGQNPIAEQVSAALVDAFECIYFVNEELSFHTPFHLIILDAPVPV